MTTLSQVTFPGQPEEYVESLWQLVHRLVGQPIYNATTGKTGRIVRGRFNGGQVMIESEYPD